ncbi:MAG: valine--tRNA ligase, partial [Oscillospiraceae bacterium]|nr:valine--tRNA ligase [Oscillospiraceae bacterium]
RAQLIIVTDRADIFENGRAFLEKLAHAGEITVTASVPEVLEGMVSVVTGTARMFMPMAELVDLGKERARIQNALEKARREYDGQIAKLGNERFIAKAPARVVEAEKERTEKAAALVANLTESLRRLG